MMQRSFLVNVVVLVCAVSLGACGGGDGGNGGAPTGTSNNGGGGSIPTNSSLVGGSVQGQALNLAGDVTTWAGLIPATNGTGVDVHFAFPSGIATDGSDIYIADTNDQIIRKLALADSSGAVSTIAGSGSPGMGNGSLDTASFNYPHGLAIFGTKLYVADTENNQIRLVDLSNGTVSLLAGSAAGLAGNADGKGTAALFHRPEGLAVNANGTMLYVADTFNHNIRQIDPVTQQVTTIAGSVATPAASGATNSSTGTSATFAYPVGLAFANNFLYVADSLNHLIRVIDLGTSGDPVSTLAGTGGAGYLDAPIGPATSAEFNFPEGLAVDSVTTPTKLYVADSNNSRIRVIDLTSGAVSTYAGDGTIRLSNNNLDPTKASLNNPLSLAFIGNSLYVTDSSSSIIREINSNGITTPVGYSTLNNPDSSKNFAIFFFPEAATTDGTNLYIVDNSTNTVRKVQISNVQVTTMVAESSGLNGPEGITNDGTYLYVTDSGNDLIRRVAIANGNMTTLSTSGLASPMGITTDGAYLYVADTGNNAVKKIDKGTGVVVTTLVSGLNSPSGISYDGKFLYVTETGNNAVLKLDKNNGNPITLAAGGSLHSPTGITCDGTYLYVTDVNAVHQIDIASGNVTDLAGTETIGYTDSISGKTPLFNGPMGITTDDTYLYILDSGNNTIRLMQ